LPFDFCHLPSEIVATVQPRKEFQKGNGKVQMVKTTEHVELVCNAAGRLVPITVNDRTEHPYEGVQGRSAQGRKQAPPIRSCADYPANGDKRVADLETALKRCGLRDGMVISSHHHLRDGDRVAVMALEAAARLGVRDLMWFPSASFPSQASVINLLESGAVHHIEGSMNGPLGDYCTQGRMRGMGVLRSHGGRWQAIQDSEVCIDVAVIAGPCADAFGNANGAHGKSACGSLGFALADSIYADRVIVVTDNLVPFPCIPSQIQGNNVDYVVEVDSIGDPAKIVSGTTQVTRSPDRLRIARTVAQFIRDAGIMRNGFSFQAGAGGIALAFVAFLKDMMKEAGVKARFVRGGSTKYLVELLREGLTDYILDGQTFDLDAVRSIASDPRHVPTSPFTSYNFHGKGNFATMVDVVILGATEVDTAFNGNVVTHSDGRLLHGIGGWQNCLFAGCTILALPSFRDRIPVIVDRVTTLTGPGELIDVVVTERGIAINPRRQDLIDATCGSHLPIRPIQDIQQEVEQICGGKPEKPVLGDRPVAVVKWVDGTVLDTVWQVG
jgi:citrate lyase subunit alpha / citrate CoA-transferase